MSHRTGFDWFSPRRGSHGRSPSRALSAMPYCRRLRFEPLEDRCLLAAGTLDTTFGNGGKVTTEFFHRSNPIASAVATAITPNGKIVVAGTSYNDFALARYNADGTLDTSFNGYGKLTTDFGGYDDEGNSVALQSDGKIVVAGFSNNGINNDFALARYNANGTLDTSFDGDGKLTTDFGGSIDEGNSVAVQSDGKIIVAGSSYNGTNTYFALARYNANGTLDTSFDSDGKLTTTFGASDDYGYSVALQSDDKIVVVGDSVNGTGYDFAVARYNANGTLDTSFDGDGKLTTDFGGSYDYGRSVAVQSDGKIVVAGDSTNGTGYDFAVARYNANGTLDTSFDGDGKLTTAFGASDYRGLSVAVQSNGKIVVAGASNNGTNYDFALRGTTRTAHSTRRSTATASSPPTSALQTTMAGAWPCRATAKSSSRAALRQAVTPTSPSRGTTRTARSTRRSTATASSPPTSMPQATMATAWPCRVTARSLSRALATTTLP